MTAFVPEFYPEDSPGVWGARAIFQRGFVDLLPDRQGVIGDYKTTLEALNAGVLQECRALADQLHRAYELQGDSHDVWVLHQADDLIVVASTNASYGYLYMCAFTPAETPADTRRCSCAHNTDGSVTTSMCPSHADRDPCLTMSLVTGRRRKGTIRRGVCTACGYVDAVAAS